VTRGAAAGAVADHRTRPVWSSWIWVRRATAGRGSTASPVRG